MAAGSKSLKHKPKPAEKMTTRQLRAAYERTKPRRTSSIRDAEKKKDLEEEHRLVRRELFSRVIVKAVKSVDPDVAISLQLWQGMIRNPHVRPALKRKARENLMGLLVPRSRPGRPRSAVGQESSEIDKIIWTYMQSPKRTYREWREECGSKQRCYEKLAHEVQKLTGKRVSSGSVSVWYCRMKKRQRDGEEVVRRPPDEE